jgi:hypothetical protein
LLQVWWGQHDFNLRQPPISLRGHSDKFDLSGGYSLLTRVASDGNQTRRSASSI